MNSTGKIRKMTVAGLLGALTVVLSMTPLGFIPVPTPAGAATTMHIPVILAGILEGPIVGGMVGLVFGLMSFLRATLPLFKDPLIAIVPRVLIGVMAYYSYQAFRSKGARQVVVILMGFLMAHTIYYSAEGIKEALSLVDTNWLQGILLSWASSFYAVLGLAFLIGGITIYLAHKWLTNDTAPIAIAAIVGTLTNTVGVLGLAFFRGYFGTGPEAAKIVAGIGFLHGIPEMLVAVIVVVGVAKGMRKVLPKTE